MKKFNAVFRIVEDKNCPLYEKEEQLLLSEKTMSCPKDKEVCLILVRDLTELLFKFLQHQPVNLVEYEKNVFNCSGCTGLIKFSLLSVDPPLEPEKTRAFATIDSAVKEKYGKVLRSPLLQTFPVEKIETILANFEKITLAEGEILIHEGEPNFNLYIVFEGELLVENGGVQVAVLTEGEVCGEMSYLRDDVASSTVRARKITTVLAIFGDVFGSLLEDNVVVQAFMAQLLAKRLTKSNAARARDFDSCMSGRIDELVPAELFQVFHMHQKTGVLLMELPDGPGKVSFREGCIINASYGEAESEAAIFKILAEKKGVYRFSTGLSPQDMRAAEIGDFMGLLMEGVRRVDEEQPH